MQHGHQDVQIMDREWVDNPQQVQWGRPRGQQVPPRWTNPPSPPAISPHNAQHLEAIQNGREHELMVERGGLNVLRVLESMREKMQLQAIEFTSILAEQAASDAAEKAMEHRVDVEFNNQAKFICNWLLKSIKCSQFCRNYKNTWINICQKKIAWLKILICWRSSVIYSNIKKWIKERVLIGK